MKLAGREVRDLSGEMLMELSIRTAASSAGLGNISLTHYKDPRSLGIDHCVRETGFINKWIELEIRFTC